ncbi:PREDICTED: interleukin-22 receptor subunit alpha-1-like [Nanorana parkeri]|uniref:interleukin-22 receptor subunit alpha-1-like n=1 Tax=Nanorana parkeri TaxID=125878 RepID=UPI000854CBC5|nr:PREDICTED: interleukin-22 receptor subunit alpha-1-like [Nanorana parkeri]
MKRSLYYLFFSFLSVNLCHSCLNFTHHNVTFNATNFEYVLQWNKDHLPSDVLFSVEYKRYGQIRWSTFNECQNIPETYCDLTNGITSDLEDFMEHQYFGRVSASIRNCSSNWVMSNRLNPHDDTFLILPKVKYSGHVSSVTIHVATPTLALRSKNNKSMTVEDLYRDQSFEYHLSIFNAEKHDKWQKPQKNNTFEVFGLSPNTEYNGSVYIMIGDKRKSDIQDFVLKTLPDHSLVTLTVSLIGIFAVVLGIAMIYMSCKYVRRQAKTPSSLDFKKVTRIQIMTAVKEKHSSCTVGFFPSMLPSMNNPSRTQYSDQSRNAQPKSYVSQSQSPVSNKDSALLSQVSYNLQQNNRMNDSSVLYGLLDSNIEHQSNHTPNILNTTSQLEMRATANGQPLDKDSGTLNWLENDGCTLILSVVVSDASEFLGLEEHNGTHSPVSLSDIISPGLPNDPVENNVVENSLLELDRSQYRLQYPVEDSQLSFINGTFISEQPYRFQH